MSIRVDPSGGTFTVSPIGPRAGTSPSFPAPDVRVIVIDGYVMAAAFVGFMVRPAV